MKPTLNYVELPVATTAEAKKFYEAALGWEIVDYAPTYSGSEHDGTNIGLEADRENGVSQILPVFEVADLEAALERITSAGGRLVQPIFDFPGGRRFHVCDPSGNMLGIWQRN